MGAVGERLDSRNAAYQITGRHHAILLVGTKDKADQQSKYRMAWILVPKPPLNRPRTRA